MTGGLCFTCNALLPNGNFSIGVTGSSAIQCARVLHAHASAAGSPTSPSVRACQSTQIMSMTQARPPLRRNWTVLVEPASASGTWYLSSGGTSFASDPITDPPHVGSGQFAVTGQAGPGAYALVSPAFPVSVRMSLQLDYFVISLAPYVTPTPDNLSSFSDPNQQACLPRLHDATRADLLSRRGPDPHASVHIRRPVPDDMTLWR
jgi:hypothetical protein